MPHPVVAALTRPDSFFAERAEDPSLLYPAVVVAVVGLLSVLASVPVFLALREGIPEGAGPFLAVGAAVGVAFAFVGPFVVWLLFAAAFHAISAVFDGEGRFRKTFVLAGWGFLPRVFASALSLVATLVVLRGRSYPPLTDPQAIQAFARSLQADPLLRAVTAVGILLTLWSGYIWLYAVANARDLTRRQALLTVALPVLVSVALSANNLL